MENALWNGRLIAASDIKKDYIVEKKIRHASGLKELCCPDPDCQETTLRYCHGEKKEAYFAHLKNSSCDYAQFDKSNTYTIRYIANKLYVHFKDIGYAVKQEQKIIQHHYSHLILEMGKDVIAIELVTQKLSANRLAFLDEAYKKAGVLVKWLVIDDTNTLVNEKHTYFIKRYQFNESNNKSLMVINWIADKVAQYKADPNQYIYCGDIMHSDNYASTYHEIQPLSELVVENNELSISGFNDRYDRWIAKKRSAFNKKVKTLQEESENKRIALARHNENMQKAYEPPPQQYKHLSSMSKPAPSKDHNQQIQQPSYDLRRKSVLKLINQQEEQARDILGERWVKCECCGAVKTEEKFAYYGGKGHVNLGTCSACIKK